MRVAVLLTIKTVTFFEILACQTLVHLIPSSNRLGIIHNFCTKEVEYWKLLIGKVF